MRTDTKQLIEANYNKLLDRLTADSTGKALDDFIEWTRNFRHYSFCNRLLIYSQCDTAQYVTGIKTWNKLGRHVNKGEKAIRILAPRTFKATDTDDAGQQHERHVLYFVAVPVFDVGQTSGQAFDPSVHTVDSTGQVDAAMAIDRLQAYAVDQGIKNINLDAAAGINSFVGGWVDKDGISITDNGQSDYCKLATLVHELAHKLLDHKGNDKDQRASFERQAEFVAFNVCAFLGLDIHSEIYLASWAANKINLSECITATSKIIDKVTGVVRQAKTSAAA